MGGLGVLFLFAGGALVLFGPLVLVLFAVDGRSCGHQTSPRRYAKAALWSGFVIYAGLAVPVFLGAKNGPSGAPPWEFVLSGLARMPLLVQVAVGTNGLAVLWAWWILRDEESHPDRAKVDEALAEEREAEEWRRKAREAAPSNPTADGG